jgi:4,5-DOPA dioxygenase extradiol
MITRRALLGGATALSISARGVAAERAPVALYVSHGAPLFMPGQAERRAALAAWGRQLATPRGVLVMTPHFASRTLAVGKLGEGFAWYDLPGGLKQQLPQDLAYRSPSNEQLAAQLSAALGARLPVAEERRGFDHTTWMPLLCLRPAADVPVLELCYPYVSEAQTLELGRKLAPLAREGVLFLASGGLTHNLSLDFVGATPAFATEFDAWATERVMNRDVDALCDWRHRAPASRLAHPDDGAHFRVVLAALGLTLAANLTSVTSPVHGFEASLSTRGFEFG